MLNYLINPAALFFLIKTNFLIFDNDGRKIQWFIIGIKKEELYDNTGKLLPLFKEIHGDTVFCNLEYEDDGVFY